VKVHRALEEGGTAPASVQATDGTGDMPDSGSDSLQKIFSSMMAATGRQLKQSVNVFQSLML
jgi:hypothetical protein